MDVVFAGLDLAQHQIHLMDAYLESQEANGLIHYRTVTSFEPAHAASGSLWIPELGKNQVEEMLDWGLPVLLCAGHQHQNPEAMRKLYESGAGALFFPGAPSSFLFPSLEASQTGSALLIMDDPFRRLYRQAFLFSGYMPRTDLRNASDITLLMDGMREQSSIVVVADLDCQRVDTLLLCHELDSYLKKNPSMASRLRILLLKDFHRPGLDPGSMRSTVQRIARRIFHPIEGALVLVESLLLYGMPDDIASARFRNLDTFLYANRIQSLRADPDRIFRNASRRLNSFSRALPFLWLYDLFRDLASTGAITLQPDVNPGNLLYGIRGPGSSGESFQNLNK
ncbi:MAG: hypothetical protein CMF59_13335 [Leptospiraceae bacterium]|nr:hypothetical protein [Leptospiraceae bacterium]